MSQAKRGLQPRTRHLEALSCEDIRSETSLSHLARGNTATQSCEDVPGEAGPSNLARDIWDPRVARMSRAKRAYATSRAASRTPELRGCPGQKTCQTTSVTPLRKLESHPPHIPDPKQGGGHRSEFGSQETPRVEGACPKEEAEGREDQKRARRARWSRRWTLPAAICLAKMGARSGAWARRRQEWRHVTLTGMRSPAALRPARPRRVPTTASSRIERGRERARRPGEGRRAARAANGGRNGGAGTKMTGKTRSSHRRK